jgi:hypothetical protein
MSVCSCVVMSFTFYTFSAVMSSRRRRGVVMVWRVATLPMSYYIVRKIPTRGVPKRYADYLRTLQPLVALWFYVSTEFPFGNSSNLWYLRLGVTNWSVGLESVVMWAKSAYGGHNRRKGNVLCFSKSQQDVTFSCSRLWLEVWCIAFDKVCS